MRIVCPSCDATYDVPDAMLGDGGRVVRCAKCGHEWTPGATSVAPLPPEEPDFDLEAEAAPKLRRGNPPPTEAAAETADEPDPLGRHEPRLKPRRPRVELRLETPPLPDLPPPRGGAGAIIAWTLSLLLLAGAAAAAVAWRTQVMSAWPPSERVFAALGLG